MGQGGQAAVMKHVKIEGERIGASGLALRWKLAGGMLHADANLSETELDGFSERLPGTTFFSTHGEAYHAGRAPAWAVRWSRT